MRRYVWGYLCQESFPGAEPSPGFNFNIAMHGDTEEELDGTQLSAEWTFSSLQKFGQEFLKKLQGKKLPNKLLEKVGRQRKIRFKNIDILSSMKPMKTATEQKSLRKLHPGQGGDFCVLGKELVEVERKWAMPRNYSSPVTC